MTDAAVGGLRGPLRRPRLGFLGVGWIGRHRMQAIVNSGTCEVVAIVEPSEQMAVEARRLAPKTPILSTIDQLLSLGAEGIVIATPSALHAEQSIQALSAGAAVFCQKPLGRDRAEVEAVLASARRADRLLGVDFSYRFTEAMRRIREIVRSGELGLIHAAELVFHNSYGPDKAWFYKPELSGGGCLMDLGVHLVDLALWTLDFPSIERVEAKLFARGARLSARPDQVEDYAVATLDVAGDAVVRLACSWRLHAGCDAVISAAFYGTEGGVAMHNVGGSFYDFAAERYRGTAREILASPPDQWGGRAAVDWAARLAVDPGFDASAQRFVDVASVIDRMYGR